MNGYMSGRAEVRIHLDLRAPYCINCDLCKLERDFHRYECIPTGEYLVSPMKERGLRCPMLWEEE